MALRTSASVHFLGHEPSVSTCPKVPRVESCAVMAAPWYCVIFLETLPRAACAVAVVACCAEIMKSFVFTGTVRPLVLPWIKVPEPAAPTVFTLKTQPPGSFARSKRTVCLTVCLLAETKTLASISQRRADGVTTFPTSMILSALPGFVLNALTSFCTMIGSLHVVAQPCKLVSAGTGAERTIGVSSGLTVVEGAAGL